MYAIQTNNLNKQYKQIHAVNNLIINIQHGELFALLGVNGAGKTTTIKMLTCLTKPTSGDALINGYSISTQSDKIKQIIGVSPQEAAVAPNLTAKEDKKYEYFLLKKEWIKEIIDFMEPFETNPFCFYHDEGMLCKVHDEMIDRSIATSKRKPIVAKDISDFWSIENAKMMFRMKEELTPVVEKYLEEHPFEFYKGFKTQSTLIEFMDKRISKGYGLQQLCQLTNIPLEEVVAYGDTTNDNEMLQVAGLGVCLLNGSDDTKAIADEITKSVCTEDGFANHVEERIFPLIK